ncbi:MAG: hypothetical protein GXX79_14845 [Actinomycetales bacterium]|nr:hypothetical protein [Actinomycetales bacterium]
MPWLAEEFGGARLWAAGQDLASLARLVDVVMPMTYSFMTGSSAGHIAALCDELRTTTGKPVMPSLQADNTYREGELPMAAVEQMLDEVERSSDGGYSVFHLESLADRPELRRLLASRAPA